MCLQHPAIVGRGQARKALGHAGLGLASAGGSSGSLGRPVLGLRRVQRGLGQEALGAQIARTLVGRLGVGQVRVGLGEACLRLGHTGLGGAVVDHGQHLAGLHRVAGFHRQRGDAARGLGREHALAHRLQVAVEQQAGVHRLGAHHHDGHLRAGRGRGLARRTHTRRAQQGSTRHQAERERAPDDAALRRPPARQGWRDGVEGRKQGARGTGRHDFLLYGP
ncbi:hypothetical protein D9M68_792720 [compost metagenome]